MNKPTNYSKSTIQHLNEKYSKIANEINKTRKNTLKNQTIVYNLSESFVDPYTFPTVKIDPKVPNPVKFIQSMAKRSTYGSMLSAGYGGGTANMAVHPFIGTYYSRVEDYKRFKFNKFVYLGSKYKIIDQKKLGKSTYNSDYTTYANGLKQINSMKGGQFINLISIQNHMPYNNWYPNNEYMGKVSGELFNTAAIREQMATYMKGVQYTDKAVNLSVRLIRSRSQSQLSSMGTTTQVSCHKTTLVVIQCKCTQLATSFILTSMLENMVLRAS